MTDSFMYGLLVGQGVPLREGLLTFLAFVLTGLFVGWQNGKRFSLTFMAQFCYATLAIRVVESFIVFHHPLREGLAYPFFWISGALFGLWFSRHKRG